MQRALALSALMAAALLGGCLGGTEEEAGVDALPDTTRPPPPAEEGHLIGAVTDLSQVPIAGATVSLLKLPAFNVTSALDGSYAMRSVPPGEHLVRAEAAGFIGETFLVRIKSGQTTLLDVSLEQEPSNEPYHETRELTGLISCSWVIASADTPTYPPCVEADPNARSAFEVPVGSEPARLLVELIWTAEHPLARVLAMNAQTVGHGPQDSALGEAEGETILRLDIPGALLSRYFGDGGKVRVNVTAAPSLGDEEGVAVGAAIQQEFTLLVTAFYVEPGPEDFSAIE